MISIKSRSDFRFTFTTNTSRFFTSVIWNLIIRICKLWFFPLWLYYIKLDWLTKLLRYLQLSWNTTTRMLILFKAWTNFSTSWTQEKAPTWSCQPSTVAKWVTIVMPRYCFAQVTLQRGRDLWTAAPACPKWTSVGGKLDGLHMNSTWSRRNNTDAICC